MLKLEEGQKAPNVNLAMGNGNNLDLSSILGQNVVLYFYPKDNTPGCTIEAQDFSSRIEEFKKLNTLIVGVSKDDLKSHEKFKTSCDLKVMLSSDLDGSICDAYGVWVEKSMLGKKYFGIERSTFLIDTRGFIRKIWRAVSAFGHAEEVLKEVRSLS